MKTVSLCMIVRNEEEMLEQCVNSVRRIADEIIICDTGSTDSTIKIAKKFTKKVLTFNWIDDFSSARNYCESFAKSEYILTWDADNVLDQKSLPFILDLKNNDFDNIDLIYGTWVVERSSSNEAIKKMRKVFIFRKNLFRWESPIHNKLVLREIGSKYKEKRFSEISFTHYKDKKKKQHRYKQTLMMLELELAKNRDNPRLLFFYAESLLFDGQYSNAAQVFMEFLDKYEKLDHEKSSVAIEKIMLCNLYLEKIDENLAYIKKFRGSYSDSLTFLLTYADSVAAKDLIKSEAAYKKYYYKIQKTDFNENELKDVERYLVHPRMMLSAIYIIKKQNTEAMQILKEVLDLTRSPEIKERAQQMLVEISGLP